MRWPWQSSTRKSDTKTQRLDDAEKRLTELKQRAERVTGELTARDKRNHWGETVSAIARRET